MQLANAEKVTTFPTHINTLAIHKLMKRLQQRYNIPPAKNLADYLSMLQERGLVSGSQAEEIRKLYKN